MVAKFIDRIFQDYVSKYKKDYKEIDYQKFINILEESIDIARSNYEKIKSPKTSSLNLYLRIWINNSLEAELMKVRIARFYLLASYRSTGRYFTIFPYDSHIELNIKLFDAPINERPNTWRDFNLPMKEIEKRFINMTFERIEHGKIEGFKSYVDMFLSKYKIPEDEFIRFQANFDNFIDYSNKILPEINNLPDWFYSNFNLPCYMCLLSTMPFKYLDEVLIFIEKEYPVLRRYKNKIGIKVGDSRRMAYLLEEDFFEIHLSKYDNINHQSITLIHELGHVNNYLSYFKKGIDPLVMGKHVIESQALEFEMSILKKISDLAYRSFFADILLVFRRILFEIEIYKNPNQNLSKLYAETFNRCFKGAKQKENPLYILDDQIVLKPFNSLPHAVAAGNLISRNIR